MSNVVSRHRNAEEIRSLRSSNHSLREIADRFGISRQAIDQILNPLKAAARGRISRAVNEEKISKPKGCQSCGKEGKTEAHHPNYAFALDVVWLCPECHTKVHPATKKPDGAALNKVKYDMTKEQLRKRRKRMGITQRELAARLGVTVTTVARWEIGDRGIRANVATRIVELDKELKGAA